ncbi:MAG: glycerophosphodiester phosphodiesterase family protein [Bacteroidia bacterium]|nr:glycerophosphodiester phosphodiesterase family protein [Bacteroidia bacterium]
MKKYYLLLVCWMTHTCLAQSGQEMPHKAILDQMFHPAPGHVLVVAHRGDWRHAPENSLRAVRNCLSMGVDIVEIDIQMTRDSQLIVMHDKTLDRTTTGKGAVSDWPLDSIRTLYLKNGMGHASPDRVPTLEEVMHYVKGKPILVNLDKAWSYLPQTYAVLKKTGTVDQGIFKAGLTLPELRAAHGNLMDSIHFMPMVYPPTYKMYAGFSDLSPMAYTTSFTTAMHVIGCEVIVDTDSAATLEVIRMLNRQGVSVWINTLWPQLCAGHQDDLAEDDPDAHWGWAITRGANIIQTDRPAALIAYLRSRGLHP